MSDQPRLYWDLAEWWPLIDDPADYKEEADFYTRTILEAVDAKPREVLELGSGGGNNASHMKKAFTLTLVDLSPQMQKVSKALNPELEHIEGDMRTVRLGREFDAVFVHDAIDYLTSLDDLSAAVETAFVHTRAGGVALFCPDHIRENFQVGTDHGGEDGADRSLRYLQWWWDPDPSDSTYITDFAYLIREGDGEAQVVKDRHILGLFSEAEWLGVMADAGFEAEMIPFLHSEVPEGAILILAGKPLV
jgi:SAM-dependent methyltransferase